MRRGLGNYHLALLVAFFLVMVLPWLAADLAALAQPAEIAGETAPAPPEEHVTASLVADVTAVKAGQPFRLGVELTMQPGWHTYYKEPGDAGMPTRIEWTLPQGFSAGELQWQKPERFDEDGMVTYGYKDRTLLAATITPPAELPAAGKLSFSARVKWLACREVCIPGGQQVSLELPVAAAGIAPRPANQEKFASVGFQGGVQAGPPPVADFLSQKFDVKGGGDQHLGFLAYAALAFVGGFILNFMPCVLPVISIKVLSFVQQAGENPRRVFNLGLIFTAGILASFLALGALVIALQQAGQSVGWGFQFQHPGFIIAMATVILLLALSLFGLFYVSVPAGGGLDRLASKEGAAGTFFKGVLATILATPCTAPFLGTALGFAFAQPWWMTLAIFSLVGLGMAFPYVILTARPGWMRYIPKPGPWMESFKQSMGFLLLATVVWLLWILGSQVGVEGVMWTLCFLVAVAFSAWLVGTFTDLRSSTSRRVAVWAAAVAVTGIAYGVCIESVPGLGRVPEAPRVAETTLRNAAAAIAWQPFTREALNRELTAGKTVFLDFTADWCLTCKMNEQAVIDSKAVVEKMLNLEVVAMKADWTRQDEEITRLLRKFGRSGVPLYVIFPAGRPTEPIVLPEVITQPLVLQKLSEAGPSRKTI